MAIKTITKQVTKEIEIRVCDICGEESEYFIEIGGASYDPQAGVSKNGFYRKFDVCRKCIFGLRYLCGDTFGVFDKRSSAKYVNRFEYNDK